MKPKHIHTDGSGGRTKPPGDCDDVAPGTYSSTVCTLFHNPRQTYKCCNFFGIAISGRKIIRRVDVTIATLSLAASAHGVGVVVRRARQPPLLGDVRSLTYAVASFSRKRIAAGQPAGLQQQQQQQQSESLLPPAQQQAKSENVPLYDASDLANVLDLDADMLRGIPTTALLAGHGRLFAEDGAVARADPAGVFALSKPVPQLDLFISHAWRTQRWPKYICLLLYLNFWPAIGAYAVGAYIAFWCATFFFDFLPDFVIFDEQPGMFDAVQLRSTWVCSTRECQEHQLWL